MSEVKTKVTNASVAAFVDAIEDETKRQDSAALLTLFSKCTGEQPKMWGSSIVGFGQYHYKSEKSSQEADWMLTGFSPRKQAMTLYVLSGPDSYADYLDKLGKHKTGKGCLYISKLADINIQVLEKLISKSYQDMKARTS